VSTLDDGVTVGIDIGTTSVKAVAADADGRVLARSRIPHDLRSPAPGAFEHDVDDAWRADVVTALAEVVESLGGDTAVAAVNVSAMIPSLGAVDTDGRAVGPGLLYGDHRGADREVDTDEPGDTGELVEFLRWHRANSPDAAGFWPAQAVANHALTGRAAIDTTTATSALPLFDWTGWDEAIAAEVGVSTATLPDIVPGVEAIGRVRDGLPAAGAVVGGGIIDALGEQVVAGADEAGDVLVICGGTLITWSVVDDWVTVPGLWTVPHTTPGRMLVGGPSNAGGLFVDHVARWLGGHGPDDGAALPDDLPVWLPYVRGERTPLHRRDLTASLHDAGLHHGPGHVLDAALEATAFVARRHIELVAATGGAPKRLVVTGGGVRSRRWMQALADTTGLPVDVVAVPEGAALGSAFMARCVAGLERNLDHARRWATIGDRVEPDERRREGVDRRYRRFESLTASALADAAPAD